VLEFLAVQAGCQKPRRAVTVSMYSTLRDVLHCMVMQDVHHVYVVPPGEPAVRQPLGVITPTDLLYLFDQREAPPPSELGLGDAAELPTQEATAARPATQKEEGSELAPERTHERAGLPWSAYGLEAGGVHQAKT
jgi:hypothetical protein